MSPRMFNIGSTNCRSIPTTASSAHSSQKLHLIHTKELKELSALGAGCSALFLTEGTGLLFRQYWAEWLTIIATSSLIPFEIFQLVKQFSAIGLLLLVGNVGIALFLIYRVRQRRAALVHRSKPGHEGRQSVSQSPLAPEARAGPRQSFAASSRAHARAE
jgi:hypothetical protein